MSVKFTSDIKQILYAGFGTWIVILIQIAIGIEMYLYDVNPIGKMVFIIMTSAIITLPSLIIYVNYIQHTKGKTIELFDDRIECRKDDKTIIINKAEIDKIIFTEGYSGRYPWVFFCYYSFQSENERITFPHLLGNQESFWKSKYSKGIERNKIKRKKSFYPWIGRKQQLT
jgi:hypothetical protein